MRLVFGLGRSGLGVLRFLARHGMTARFFDQNPKPADVASATALGFTADSNPQAGVYQQVIAAPGVPIDHGLLQSLKAGGAEVIGEAELGYRHCNTPIVGITGTAGKGTATVLTAHFLQALGFKALAGGNLDPPLLDILEEAEVAVAEMSSFQLERVQQFKPRVAVLLNLGIDHLDRHQTLEAYHAAKLRLIQNLTPQDALVYNAQDPAILAGIAASKAQLYPFTPAINPRESNLNAAWQAAIAYARLMGHPPNETALQAAIESAPSLEGRFETFARLGDVSFIDDSIATRFDAVKAALQAAPSPIAWIMGGVDKGAPLAPLRPLVQERVQFILAIGQDGPRMAQSFADLCEVCSITAPNGAQSLHLAVEAALDRLSSGSVLLAPLGTSFDQFKDYKERSKTFREVVFALGGQPWTGS